MAEDRSAAESMGTAREPRDSDVTELVSAREQDLTGADDQTSGPLPTADPIASSDDPPRLDGDADDPAPDEVLDDSSEPGDQPSSGDQAQTGSAVDQDATAPMSRSELDEGDPDATVVTSQSDAESEPSESDGAADLDATAPMSRSELDEGDPDATVVTASPEVAAAGDATQPPTPGDEPTTVLSASNEPTAPIPYATDDQPTSVLRPQVPDATAVMPPAAEAARWRASANVPVIPREPDDTGQWSPAEPGRAWWLPILLAVIGLLLLLGIAYALITAAHNNRPSAPGPTVPATPSATPSPTPASTPPTSAPASTTPTTAGTPYIVPSSLIGLQVNDAQSILNSAGIASVAVPQTDNTDIPNTVIGTDPAAGQPVPDGGTVTLYYAQPTLVSPSSTPPTDTPSPSASASGG